MENFLGLTFLLLINNNILNQEKNREKTQETIRILTEKRKNLPSINAPENYDKTSQELAEMGYLHEEIMWGEDIDMFK